MEAYRFNVKISKNGAIKLPSNTGFSNMEAEVIILLKEDKRDKDFTASDFVKNWAGILKNNCVDDTKFDYLSKKHQ